MALGAGLGVGLLGNLVVSVRGSRWVEDGYRMDGLVRQVVGCDRRSTQYV